MLELLHLHQTLHRFVLAIPLKINIQLLLICTHISADINAQPRSDCFFITLVASVIIVLIF